MRTERFIIEYANFCKREIAENDLMRDEIKADAIAKIDKVVLLRAKGMITVDETIQSILDRFEK